MPPFTMEALDQYTASSLDGLQHRHADNIERWRALGESLPHVPDEPFHTALVEAIDAELDLLERGPQRFSVPLQAVNIARYSADTTGFVRYKQLFADRPDPVPQPTPLPHLLGWQEHVLASILAKARTTSAEDKHLLWKALGKEVAQGLGAAHVGRPEPDGAVGDVFFGRHMARRELWDQAEWVQKPRPCDDGTANGVNGAFATQSHADLFTLDRFVHTAPTFMQCSAHGPAATRGASPAWCSTTTRPIVGLGGRAVSAAWSRS